MPVPPVSWPEMLEALSVFAATVLAGIALRGQWADGKARRKSVDAAISAEAYVVRRTLRGWILAAEHLRALGASPRLVLGEQDKTVEERLQRAVAAAPHASPAVSAAIREAYVLYYRVTAEAPVESLDVLQAQSREAREARDAKHDAALADLQACIARLTDAIEPELRGK